MSLPLTTPAAETNAYVTLPQAAPAAVVQDNDDGLLSAATEASDRPLGSALHPTDAAHPAPGQYAAKTAYVDFMNRLSHRDGSRRLNVAAALKHPFLTQALGDADQLAAVLGMHDDAEVDDSRADPPQIELRDEPAEIGAYRPFS